MIAKHIHGEILLKITSTFVACTVSVSSKKYYLPCVRNHMRDFIEKKVGKLYSLWPGIDLCLW